MDDGRERALWQCVSRGLVAETEALLRAGVDVNLCSGRMTLVELAVTAKSVPLLSAVLRHGPHIEHRAVEGDGYPLIAAAERAWELVELLLEHVDGLARDVVARRTATGWTALHGAMRVGHATTVRLLLRHGARADVATKTGFYPLDCAEGPQSSAACRALLSGAPSAKLGRAPAPWLRALVADMARAELKTAARGLLLVSERCLSGRALYEPCLTELIYSFLRGRGPLEEEAGMQYYGLL